MKKVFMTFVVSSLFISFSSMAHDHKTKQEMTDDSHKEHAKCMDKTGKSMEECMKMMESSKTKSDKDKKTQQKTN